MPFVFLRDIHEGHLLSVKNTNNKESNIANALKDFDKGIKTLKKKKTFLNNLGLLFSARENVYNREIISNKKVRSNSFT